MTLFATHGAAYLALKTTDDLRARANAVLFGLGLVAAVAAVVFLAWTAASKAVPGSIAASVVAALALVAALGANRLRHELLAFAATGVTIALAVVALFANLYPNVMPSTTNAAFSLTITNASSTDLTLQIMTVVAVIFTPIVLLYEGWSYWMFRQRVVSPRVTTERAAVAGGSLGGRIFKVTGGGANSGVEASGRDKS